MKPRISSEQVKQPFQHSMAGSAGILAVYSEKSMETSVSDSRGFFSSSHGKISPDGCTSALRDSLCFADTDILLSK